MALTPSYPSAGSGPIVAAPNARYTPALYSMKVMTLFTEALVLNYISNTDFEGEIKGKGDKVYVRVAPTDMTVGDYTVNTNISYEVPGKDSRVLNIDQAKYVAFKVDDVDETQADIGLMGMFAERGAESLKRQVERAVLAYISDKGYGPTAGDGWDAKSSGNKGLTAGKVSASYDLGVSGNPLQIHKTLDNALDVMVDVGSVLDEAEVPEEGRWILIPTWWSNLLKKGDLKRADVTGDSTGVVRTGLLGEINNLTIYRCNTLRKVTDGTTTRPAFYCNAGVKDATTFASQLTKTETLPNPNQFGQLWRSLMVFGREVIMPEALVTIYCENHT